MRPRRMLVAALFVAVLTPTATLRPQEMEKGKVAPDDAKYIAHAEAGGPPALSADAAIARIEQDGSLTTLRPGTNGITCVVGVPGDPEAPFCADRHALQWIQDAVSGKPRPTNEAPGIAYMSSGGVHHEAADGSIVMEPGPETKPVEEPPHWMLMWPIDSATSGLPTKENPAGLYIMFAGTPYAHLMVYQDPDKLFQGKAAMGMKKEP